MKLTLDKLAYIDVNIKIDDILVVVERQQYSSKQVLGELSIYKKGQIIFSCCTLELPWLDNQRNISCIKPGFYNLKKYSSDKHPDVYEVAGVPDRSYILIHSGNYYFDIQGCILVGDDFSDINADGYLDVVNSKGTLKDLIDTLGYEEVPILVKDV